MFNIQTVCAPYSYSMSVSYVGENVGSSNLAEIDGFRSRCLFNHPMKLHWKILKFQRKHDDAIHDN